jgi:hypothetical protein
MPIQPQTTFPCCQSLTTHLPNPDLLRAIPELANQNQPLFSAREKLAIRINPMINKMIHFDTLELNHHLINRVMALYLMETTSGDSTQPPRKSRDENRIERSDPVPEARTWSSTRQHGITTAIFGSSKNSRSALADIVI